VAAEPSRLKRFLFAAPPTATANDSAAIAGLEKMSEGQKTKKAQAKAGECRRGLYKEAGNIPASRAGLLRRQQ